MSGCERCAEFEKSLRDLLAVLDCKSMRSAYAMAFVHGWSCPADEAAWGTAIVKRARALLERP